MNKTAIDKIKKEGQKEKLLKTASDRVWNAQRLLENSAHEQYKNFIVNLQSAKEKIDDALQFFKEAHHD